jgi:hypothetical protein
MGKLIDKGQTPPSAPLFQEGFSASFPSDLGKSTKLSPKSTGSSSASPKAIALSSRGATPDKRSKRKQRSSDSDHIYAAEADSSLEQEPEAPLPGGAEYGGMRRVGCRRIALVQ